LSNLIRIPPGVLELGRPLPWSVFDADGNILLCQGYVIRTNVQLEQLFRRGLFRPRNTDLSGTTASPQENRKRNPFEDYPDLLQALELTQRAITSEEASAHARLMGLTRMLGKVCEHAPDMCLALIHLYSTEPTVLEQTLFTAILCQLTARQFGLDPERTAMVSAAAFTANLALVQVADQLNASNHILNESQRAVIRKHPERSARALEQAGITEQQILTIILQHHEQADGGGFPRGLSGMDICPEAEILALSERYIAMITRRGYRDRISVSHALRLIASLANGTCRPAVSRALLGVLGDYPPGILVRLKSREMAVMTRRPEADKGPFARVLFDPEGTPCPHYPERDTSQPGFSVLAQEQPEFIPSMDFSRIWNFRH